jgi:hypothetical protein
MEIALFGAVSEMKLRSEKGRRCSDMLSHGRNSSLSFKTLMDSGELSQARKYLAVLRSGCDGGGAGGELLIVTLPWKIDVK